MLPAEPGRRRRIIIATALVVTLPFAFIYPFDAAVNFVLIPLLESPGYGSYHGRLYVPPLLAAIVVLGGLGAQAWFGPSTILGGIGARRVSPAEYPDLHTTVTRLARQIDATPPAVAVAYNDAPNAAAVRGPTGAAIVVTTGLLDRLEDD